MSLGGPFQTAAQLSFPFSAGEHPWRCPTFAPCREGQEWCRAGNEAEIGNTKVCNQNIPEQASAAGQDDSLHSPGCFLNGAVVNLWKVSQLCWGCCKRTWPCRLKTVGFFNRIFSVLRSAVLKGNEGVLHCLTEASTSNNLSAANSTGKKAVTHTEGRDWLNISWHRFFADSRASSRPEENSVVRMNKAVTAPPGSAVISLIIPLLLPKMGFQDNALALFQIPHA